MPIAYRPRRLLPFLAHLWLSFLQAFSLADSAPSNSKPNTTTAADSVITFNEIMYHPAGDDPRLEWIELYNQMSVNMDVSNWRIEGGIEFRFPTNTTFNANTYLIIAADPGAFTAATGVTNVFGPFSGRLSNSGETLRLRNNSSRLMDEMRYSDEDSWPVAADGSGASLAKRGRFDASSVAGNWRASLEIGGTPGRFNFPTNLPPSSLSFSEIMPGTGAEFFLELYNSGSEPLILENWQILSGSGFSFTFVTNVMAPLQYLALTTNELGFAVAAGEKLFLIAPGQIVHDGVELGNRLVGRLPSAPAGTWFHPSTATPGTPNQVSFHREIVINEIMFHHPPIYGPNHEPLVEVDEQWVELYNRSTHAVDVSDWRLDGDLKFQLPRKLTIAAGAYLVIAKNRAALQAKYPGVAIVGDGTGKLRSKSAHLILRDEHDNPVNEVTYYSDHPWPSASNGGGSSLELRDPRADNSVAESWAASIEGGKSKWNHYSYRAKAVAPVYAPLIYSFHEFRLGLLTDGEVLMDNITVQELPDSGPRQLLQNVDFTNGTNKWRLLGNHSHSFVEPNPDDPANPVLHLVARGPTSYMDNRLETTLKVGTALVPVVTGREYQIDFDAKWLAGSPQIHTELYYNKVAKTTVIEMPTLFGTPGRRNSTYVTNAGPTYWAMRHSPILPKPTEDIEVSIHSEDPDEIGKLVLFYVIKGASQSVPMSPSSTDHTRYVGTIPRQPASTVIQFYVEGTDGAGASSTYPRKGAASRALIKVDSEKLFANKQTVRTIMTPADANLMHVFTNLMSDDLLGCTVVHNEREVFYDAGIRLHGSMFSRTDPASTGMTIKLPADHLFRGSRSSIIARRRGLVETLVKHVLNAAGGLPGNYDDIIHFVSHRTDNVGSARLNLANYDDTYVDSQFENDNDGTVFKLEGIREFQTTQNGSAEGYKVPMPIGWIINYDIANLGNDPEQYRWSIMIQSSRARDDYSPVVKMGKAFSLSGAALHSAAGAAIDVDEWARLFALQFMLGIADVYTYDNPHNFCFYARPSDGRLVGLQNDWEFAFGAPAVSSIYGNKNLFKVLQLPGYRRLYQGHLLDLINSVCNRDYLTPWAKHYSTITGEGYSGHPGYVASRASSVKTKLLAQIPFEITSNGGVDYNVDTPTVTLQGRGWINVRQIWRAGDLEPLKVNWLDDQRWETVIPLQAGANRIELKAVGFRGEQLAQDAISVTSTVSNSPQRDYIRITELMYHPADPTPNEAAAGFKNSDDFEYVELQNTGPLEVTLGGIKFTSGIILELGPGAPSLGPGQRALVVKSRLAFESRYGTILPVVGEYTGSLNNAGEVLRLEDAQGALIQEFAYSDQADWPQAADGGGASLEVLDSAGDYSKPVNWQASPQVGGTPGSAIVRRPTISSVEYHLGKFTLRFNATPDQGYSLYRRTNLETGDWQKIREVAPQQNSRVEQLVDDSAETQSLYRLTTP